MLRFLEKVNIFSKEPTLTDKHGHKLASICGGVISVPIIFLIFVLFLLQFIQFAGRGIVYSSSEVNTSYEPPFTTFTTSNDSAYSPFMAAFSLTNSDSCPSASISVQATVNLYTGAYNSPNRTATTVPMNLETCNWTHFSMLPSSMNKLSQYTNKKLSCLPLDSYFNLGGANTLSSFYNNMKFNFTCPSSCASSPSCGTVEFFVVNSNVNLGSKSLFSYSLHRKIFNVQPKPTSINYYQLQTTKTTTDAGLLPFSVKNTVTSFSVADILTDIPTTAGETANMIILEASDKSVVNQRSYYRLFDLLSYMGGVIYAFFVVFFFFDYIIKLEFQMNFAAQYFRHRDSKTYSLAGMFKQGIYYLLKDTRWKPDWKIAQVREEIKKTVDKVLDVTYLNKRILFLEEAVSLLFEPHQLKGIHLLHTLTKQQHQHQLNQHQLRDRLVYYLHKSWQAQGEVYNFIKRIHTKKTLGAERPFDSEEAEAKDSNNRMVRQQNLNETPELLKKNSSNTINEHDIRYEVGQSQQPARRTYFRASSISLKHAISSCQERDSLARECQTQIIHEADLYYQSPEAIIENQELATDRRQIDCEMQYVGELSQEELNEAELVHDLQHDLTRLVEEAEQQDGDRKSKLIYDKLDGWLKNQLRLSVINHKKPNRRYGH